MNQRYYYFVASLPTLQFGTKPLLSLEDFLRDAERLIIPEDFLQLQTALGQDEPGHQAQNSILKSWIEFEHNLRNELAWYRAGRLKKDPLPYLRGPRELDPFLVNLVTQAAEAPDPLSAEQLLDKARWLKLEDLAKLHYFDLEIIIVYALQLRILERYQMIESPKGQELYHVYKKVAIPALK